MNSHERWIEKCDRCGLPAKGTAKQWLDGTRICSFCWQQLVSDLEFYQQKIHGTWRFRVYPIIREKKWEFQVNIPMETKKEINSPYDLIGDIIPVKQEEEEE